ncbi:PREDICTED: uncharacterized protein LOC108562829 [Nicrophorus vespilloides]|uniref:Uncharacterized protein LOC108562829 n=1 Tax=Nicrophorus vespilloides TaxID=110193 RepID=A0ABM1MQD6_NICVS|nr:PREDICTED: uncharacterized protein LOC108562829 [Nicrophorus vespilloides]XP_017776786.1 PREDICTED: uncharacterized protein LOC108562829 [Nicrophorus vespilloides]
MLPVYLLLAFLAVRSIDGHGRLIEPPSRASAWRYGFNTPHNFNDHELYCGGFTRQWVKNEGKCGVCGDPWDSKIPRAHEYGGAYGQGVIVRQYKPGQTINIRVELTASHFGFFEFSLCPNFKNATQECLARNILQLLKPQENVEHMSTRYFPKDGNKVYEMKYKLPKLTCPHCLLQWRYIAGNNWGDCANGTGAVGCGPQEEFRACADVALGSMTTPDEEVETNEIPEEVEQEATQKPQEQPESSYSPISSLVIGLVSFLAIFLVLSLLFFHYYNLGSKLKNWMLAHKFPADKQDAEKPPLPPPRNKKRQPDGMFEVSLNKQESLA